MVRPEQRVRTAFGLRRRRGEPGGRTSGRDAALRALDRLLAADFPVEQRRLREIRRSALRYQGPAHNPARSDSPKRTLLRQIADSGLPIPKERQLRKIIKSKPR